MAFTQDEIGLWKDERGHRIYEVEGQLKSGQRFKGFSYSGIHGGEVSLTLYGAEFMAMSAELPALCVSPLQYGPDDETSIPHTSLSWVTIKRLASVDGRAGAELGLQQFGMDRGGMFDD